ncbi:MAG: hypothetical protein GY694_13890 [Gammaproteobacteria bacterium]|nr:hypothetical protein [Gammaproteobacteria bacterium]
METIVFLGPSLSHQEARQILPARYLPPVAQSDLFSAVEKYSPDVIVMIDGVFEQSLSVWHKEILYALSKGIHVFGCSSMGALRAAETSHYGMKGFGEIYKMYATGKLQDDDEVALWHLDEESDYLNICDPMVNIRQTLAFALDQNEISEQLHDKLVAIGKNLYFPKRRIAKIVELAHQQEALEHWNKEELTSYLKNNYINQKQRDAINLLTHLANTPLSQPFQPEFDFFSSMLFKAQKEKDKLVYSETGEATVGTIARQYTLQNRDAVQINNQALDKYFLIEQGSALGIQVNNDDIETEIRRYRKINHLEDESDFQQWLDDNDLDKLDFTMLMKIEAVCRQVRKWTMTQLSFRSSCGLLANELKLQNKYPKAKQKAIGINQVIKDNYLFFDNNTEMHQAFSHIIKENDLSIDTDLMEWLEERGFENLQNLLNEIKRLYLVRQFKHRQIADMFS